MIPLSFHTRYCSIPQICICLYRMYVSIIYVSIMCNYHTKYQDIYLGIHYSICLLFWYFVQFSGVVDANLQKYFLKINLA